MNAATTIYKPSLALLTDLYQLTMAYGYWKLGHTDDQAVFHLVFRKHPFKGGYTIVNGLESVVHFLKAFRYDGDDLAYLGTLKGSDAKGLFEPAFLDYLAAIEFSCDVDAVPEGTAVFPHEPLVRVRGPLLQCQLLETPLLNLINFQTLVATKAARICQAARGEPVLEFGLRRAQGIDGSLAASRAAYVGGCSATSNVLAGRMYGMPVKGTHAHSWVMCFDDELEAFDAYAQAMPNNCIFLVDTYDTLEGVRKAIEAGRRLRQRGGEMLGIRLDSGDLAYLSIEARKMLDAAGFGSAFIVASNDLDEHIIASLKQQDAKISVWAVGTRLATAFDEPALGGVYKLSAIQRPGQPWQHKVKLSEQVIKTSTPGMLQVRRFRHDGQFLADMIFDELTGLPQGQTTIVDVKDPTRQKIVPQDTPWQDLLVPVFRGGRCVYDLPALADVRSRTQEQLAALHEGIKRFLNPHEYPAGLEKNLHDLKTRLILAARGLNA
ncbi:MAG: nicotinate phosphoribosyltransferase [Planctomycetaceae bacterium]|nr:nicotinate phosphoribosyltransferase [Planctomycetaceae bacterium]